MPRKKVIPPSPKVTVESAMGDAYRPIMKAQRTVIDLSAYAGQIVNPPVDWADLDDASSANSFHGRSLRVKLLMLFKDLRLGDAERRHLEDIIGEQTLETFLYKVGLDFFYRGNGYVEIDRPTKKLIRGMYHVPANTMYVLKLDDRRIEYVQTGTSKGDIRIKPMWNDDTNEIWHIKEPTTLSPYYGYPDWLDAIESLRIDRNIKLFYGAFFNNGAMPDHLVIIEGAELADEAKKKIKSALVQTKGVRNAHKTIFLTLPIENVKARVESLTSPMKDLQFDSIYKAAREEILAAHGVPPRLVGIVPAGQLGGEGDAEGQYQTFLETVIDPKRAMFQREFNTLLEYCNLSPSFELPPLADSAERPAAKSVIKSRAEFAW